MVYSKELLQLKIPCELRILLYAVIALVCLIAAFLFLGRIDDVIKANGIVRTEENVSSVRNVISGKIIRKKYTPGRKVEKGEVLYELDPSIFDSQMKTLEAEIESLEKRISGTDFLLASYEKNKNLVDKSNEPAYSRFESYLKNAEKLSVQKEISFQALNDELMLPWSMKNEKTVKARRMEYEYSKKNLESYRADFLNALNQEKEDLVLLHSKNFQEKERLVRQYEFLKVYAPVSGFVQETSSLNEGDYLECGQQVLNIVPDDKKNFRVEIQIPSKDMGKIKKGLSVKYRLSAFPFFEYKGAEGVITALDPDIRSGGNGFLYYMAYADLDRTVFSNRHGEKFPVKAGMETNCRIVLETETIISYLLKKIDFVY